MNKIDIHEISEQMDRELNRNRPNPNRNKSYKINHPTSC